MPNLLASFVTNTASVWLFGFGWQGTKEQSLVTVLGTGPVSSARKTSALNPWASLSSSYKGFLLEATQEQSRTVNIISSVINNQPNDYHQQYMPTCNVLGDNNSCSAWAKILVQTITSKLLVNNCVYPPWNQYIYSLWNFYCDTVLICYFS